MTESTLLHLLWKKTHMNKHTQAYLFGSRNNQNMRQTRERCGHLMSCKYRQEDRNLGFKMNPGHFYSSRFCLWRCNEASIPQSDLLKAILPAINICLMQCQLTLRKVDQVDLGRLNSLGEEKQNQIIPVLR